MYLFPRTYAQPALSMSGVNNVLYDRATFSAVMTDKGGWSTINGYGFVYDTISPPARQTGAKIKQISTLSPPVGVQFNSTPTIFNELLASGKTYYVRAYVKRSSPSIDTAYSDIYSFFVPSPSLPTLSVKPANSIGLNVSTMVGSVNAINDAPVILSKGFVYDSIPDPRLKTGKTLFKTGNISTYPYNMTHILTYLTEGQDYYYRTFCIVKFNNRIGNDTVYSDTIKFTTKHTCGIIPYNIVVDQLEINSARVRWTKGFNQTQWQLDYGLVGHVVGDGATINSSNDTITLNGLVGGKPYSLYVRARCPDKFSDWSDEITFTTLPPLCPPSSNIYPVDLFHSSAILSWSPGSMLQDKWEVSFGLYSSPFPSNTTIITKNPYFYPTGLKPTTRYKMKVRAVCGDNNYSEWTDDFNFNTKPAGLDDIEEGELDIEIFPNPSEGMIYFKTEDKNINKIEIWNSLGEIVYTNTKIPNSFSFSPNEKGLFLVRIHSNDIIKTKKIIIK